MPTSSSAASTPNLFSIDVEDWFHAEMEPTAAEVEGWVRLESRVERNFRTLLDLLSAANVTATCFILGWVAERYPAIVKEAAERGHEIASHGYGHRLVTSQTRAEFSADIRKARSILEQVSGKRVIGYRAPSFSITKENFWALDELAAAGYRYDASIFPTERENGGIVGFEKRPHVIQTANGPIVEFPMSVARLFGKDLCFFGGGYLRLFPAFLIRRMSAQVNAQGRPVVYFVHPREVDPAHPRLPMSPLKRFKRYVNLETTVPKLRMLMKEHRFMTFENWLSVHGQPLARLSA